MTILPVSPANGEARALMREMQLEITALYPDSVIITEIDEGEFLSAGGYFVVAAEEAGTVGCGGFRPVNEECAEIKRMFVAPGARRRGIAREILRHLEAEVRRRGFLAAVLETGRDNAAAIALYEAEGYGRIPEFPGCAGLAVSRCYCKRL